MTEEQPQEEQEPDPIVILDDRYVKAFLGNSVSPIEPPRAVYSLPLLCEIEAKRLGSDEVTAQKSVIAMMRTIYQDHGASAPHFIDDDVSRPPRRDTSRIIRPNGTRG